MLQSSHFRSPKIPKLMLYHLFFTILWLPLAIVAGIFGGLLAKSEVGAVFYSLAIYFSIYALILLTK